MTTDGDHRRCPIQRAFRIGRWAVERLVAALPGSPSVRVVVVLLGLVVIAPFLVSPVGGASDDDAPVQGSVEVAQDQAVGTMAAAPDHATDGQAVDAAPGSGPVFDARPVVADDVQAVRPDLVVRTQARVEPSSLFTVLGLDGVEHLAGAAEQNVTLRVAGGEVPMHVLVVDPTAFRPLTPDATARTKEVWERLADGEAVVRHDVAQRNGLELGNGATMIGPSGREVTVRVGAFASNGTPPLAEAIVPWEVGGQLGVSEPNMLIVALTDGAPSDAIRQQVQDTVGGEITEVEEPTEQQASLVGAGSHRFASFNYIDHGDGMITIDPAWVRANIVYADVPIFGTVRCHHAMIPQLRAALQEIVDTGLAGQIDTSDYGGCWVPRHILFNPDRAISMHAWGLAIDFNVHTNMYGDSPTLDPRIVQIFQRWGFEWGGDWSTPDGMHFELNSIIK